MSPEQAEDMGFLDREDLRHALYKARLARRALDDVGRVAATLFGEPAAKDPA